MCSRSPSFSPSVLGKCGEEKVKVNVIFFFFLSLLTTSSVSHVAYSLKSHSYSVNNTNTSA